MMKCWIRAFVASLWVGFVCVPGSAFQEAAEKNEEAETEEVKPTLPESWLKQMKWRSIGPANMGGRITSIAVFEKDPSTFWIATAGGGLLKTTNNGTTFEHQFDREATVSIGHVAVSQSNKDIVWVGTGEANPRNSVSWGNGVYKSIDGGKTWEHRGLDGIFQTGRIAIHPENPDIVYVGALGRLWGHNEERGLFKTTDGGETWEKVLYIDEKTGVVDVQMKPGSPETLLIATYERQRDGFDTNDPQKKWGPGSGLHLTTDGGKTFKRVDKGLPTRILGRIGIDFYQKDPNVVYVVLESEEITQEPSNAAYLGVKGENADVGARLTEVTDGGPANEAKLLVGDIVIRVEDAIVHSYSDLTREIRKRLAGDTVLFEVSRERKSHTLEVTFGKRPGEEEDAEEKEPEDKEKSEEEAKDQRKKPSGPFSSGLGGQRENVQDQQGPDGHEYGGVYRSADGGVTWTRINSVNPRPMYYSQIRVDPSDENYLYVLGTSLYRSKDRGETFTADGAGRGVHVDHHALWVDSRDGRHMILGNDGGIYVTYDRMDHWDHHNHVAIGQFYRVDVDFTRDYKVYGGLQDNGSWGGPNRVRDNSGPVNADWLRIGGGDGFFCRVDRDDPDLIYYESQNGGLGRRNFRTGEGGFLRPRAPRGSRYRFNWNTPFLLSHHNTKIYYTAGNYVFRSLDRGNGLKAISPEITKTDRGSATSLSESSRDADILYVGTDDGSVFATRDGGKNWLDLYNLPEKEEAPKEPAGKETKSAVAENGVHLAAKNGAEPKTAKGEAPLAGSWTATVSGENVPEGSEFSFTFVRTEEGKLKGSISSDLGDGDLTKIRFDSETGKVSFTFPSDVMGLDFSGTLTTGKIAGKVEASGGLFSMTFDATKEVSEEKEGKGKGRGKNRGGKADPDREGYEWKRIGELVPDPRWVSSISASRHKTSRVYLTFDGHRSNDDESRLYVSEDHGETWRSLGGNLPQYAGTTRVLTEDLTNPDLLFLGGEFSAWVSIDRGATWTSFGASNFPTVAVHDFALHSKTGEIVAATHGRSLWILDVSLLRQMNEETLQKKVHLYRPNSTILWRSEPARGSDGPRQFVGENPDRGVQIYYSLGEQSRGLSLQITRPNGDVVKTFEAGNEPGLHHFSWDLRLPPPPGSSRRFRRGRLVQPGTYLVSLAVGGVTYTEEMKVALDPEYPDPTWLEFEGLDEELGELEEEGEAMERIRD